MYFSRSLVVFLLATFFSPVVFSQTQFSSYWVNTGLRKVAQDDLLSVVEPGVTLNSVWDGSKVTVFGAKNEVVSFNVILEAGTTAVNNVSVRFNSLAGPGGSLITSRAIAGGNEVFDYTGRNIELFYIRYLQIKGLSKYSTYDERHVPERFRRPWAGDGIALGGTGWTDRPDADKFYPDIAVPFELVDSFNVEQGKNQGIWVDIYIPKNVNSGIYQGSLIVSENGTDTISIPVELEVFGFMLPDRPALKTMLIYGHGNANLRYFGEAHPTTPETVVIANAHFKVARRHKITLVSIDGATGVLGLDEPEAEWFSRLDGSLFTAANGYDGPGVGEGLDIFSIGSYSSWAWRGQGEAAMHTHAQGWEQWFQSNYPDTERFLYLTDEPQEADYPQVEEWAGWVLDSPGVGSELLTFTTLPLLDVPGHTPSLTYPCSNSSLTAMAPEWQTVADDFITDPDKRLCRYNGRRPFSGTFYTDADGVELLATSWAQYKKQIDLWFFWESTFYYNYGNSENTNVFQQAKTWGGANTGYDPIKGETAPGYANGNGVLFYPGTDTLYPSDTYGVKGPLASLRLKQWRRGIQDGDYIALAEQIDPTATQQIVELQVPEVLWEVEPTNPASPTYVRTDISWSTDPDDWIAARRALADILQEEIFSDDFELGNTSAWSTVAQ